MYQVQFNKGVLRNHFQYDSWKYLLGVVLTIFLWSMVTTIAAPRTPDDMKVDIYLVGSYMFEDAVEEVAETILLDFPELLEINIYNIMLGGDGESDYAGRQKLMVMLASQSGDVYVFEKDQFEVFAEQGAFLPLDEYFELFKPYFTEEQLADFTFISEEDGEPYLYGLPMDGITTFDQAGLKASEVAIGVMAYSKNIEKAVEVLEWMNINGRELDE